LSYARLLSLLGSAGNSTFFLLPTKTPK